MLVVYPLPDEGARYGQGVGVDCLFRTRRLAMPREDKPNIVLRFFYVPVYRQLEDGGDTHEYSCDGSSLVININGKTRHYRVM